MPQLTGNSALRYQQLRVRLTYYESVTGMPNQFVLIDRLKASLQKNDVPGSLAGLFTDAEFDRLLDNLKESRVPTHPSLVQLWALVTNAAPLPPNVRDSILQNVVNQPQ